MNGQTNHEMKRQETKKPPQSSSKSLIRLRNTVFSVLLIALLSVVMMSCGCGADETPTPTPTPTLTPTPTPETTPETTPVMDEDLPTPYTDALALTADYQGKSFIEDGIGEANLHLCIDGDTAHFTQVHGTDTRWFSVRFLAIDTPESTGRIEPWGFKASNFVCDILENADTIVLEADESRSRLDTTGNRYLGYVWADGRLINLEVVEQAYSHATGVYQLKYGEQLFSAWVDAQATGRRIHGERDPDFDYDLEYDPTIAVHIMDLVLHPERYLGYFVTVQGVVSRVEGRHPWLEQDGYGIYLYRGFEHTTHLVPGNEVRISNLQLTYWPNPETGARQLTNFRRRNMEVISRPNRGIVLGIQEETGFADAYMQTGTSAAVEGLSRIELVMATWRDETNINFDFLESLEVQISSDKENWQTIADIKDDIDLDFNTMTELSLEVETEETVHVRVIAIAAEGLESQERWRLLIKELALYADDEEPVYHFDFGTLSVDPVFVTDLTSSHVENAVTGSQVFNAVERLHANISTAVPIVPKVITIEEIEADDIDRHVGSLVTLENVEIVRLNNRLNPDYDPHDPDSEQFIPNTFDNPYFTMVVKDEDGHEIDIRKNDATSFRFCHVGEEDKCTTGASALEKGMTINITGPLTIWDGDKQLVITRVTDLVVLEQEE